MFMGVLLKFIQKDTSKFQHQGYRIILMEKLKELKRKYILVKN